MKSGLKCECFNSGTFSIIKNGDDEQPLLKTFSKKKQEFDETNLPTEILNIEDGIDDEKLFQIKNCSNAQDVNDSRICKECKKNFGLILAQPNILEKLNNKMIPNQNLEYIMTYLHRLSFTLIVFQNEGIVINNINLETLAEFELIKYFSSMFSLNDPLDKINDRFFESDQRYLSPEKRQAFFLKKISIILKVTYLH